MTERPSDIRIDDLVNPQFPAEIAEGLAAVSKEADPLHFELDALMTAASEKAGGLDDFGSEEYIEPLTVLGKSIKKESGFGPLGFISAHSQIVDMLVNRLRLEDFFKQHPEAEEIEISAPILIAGLPRSGTTHLHNLIAADSNLRSLPWWEALEPIPSKQEWDDTQGRIQRAKDDTEQRNMLIPHFDRMHEMTWDHVHEEISLLAMAGSSMHFDTMGVFPSWREHYKSQDQTPYYMYAKRALKALSFLRGAEKRWVLKSPQHLEQFQPIMNTYPDAIVLVTHRDPAPALASLATMLSYLARLSYAAPIDIKRIGNWWQQMLYDMLNSCTADREILPPSQSMDILFNEFMADDMATIEKVYELANLTWDSRVQTELADYAKNHPRGRHGRVIYDLKADFDIEPAEVKNQLADYIEKFNVQIED